MKFPQLTFGRLLIGAAVLLVVTTGTAHAANTIGSSDIINNSIRSLDIRDHTIESRDIRNGTIKSADVANFGLTNQDIGVLFATVNADGTLANSSGAVSVIKLANVGQYEVDFGRNITFCAFVATVGPAGNGSAVGEATVADRLGNAEAVFVRTSDSAGTGADRPFHLIVVC